MHFVIHTQYYPPEIGAPQARLSMLARGLVERGHRVTVLTAMPNYPQGRLHVGYGGWLKIENIDGVHVIRCWIHPNGSKSFIRRLSNYLSFVFSSFWIGLFYLDGPAVILTESPPLFLGISGYLLSRIKRARWIFNVSDLWPESAVRLGMVRHGLLLEASRRLEAFFYRQAWCVCGQSRGILKDILGRFPGTHVHHLSNGADTTLFRPEVKSTRLREELGSGTLGVYAGLHGLAQGLDLVLCAAATLKDMENLKIAFVGDGPLKRELMGKARRLDLCNVHFFDALPHGEMPGLLASADFCIVPLGLILPGAVPSKLYEAMAAGRPVLLMANGEAAEIVRAHDCGLVVEPGDGIGLAEAMRVLAGDGELRVRLGENGRRAALEHYDRNTVVEHFADFLEQVEHD